MSAHRFCLEKLKASGPYLYIIPARGRLGWASSALHSLCFSHTDPLSIPLTPAMLLAWGLCPGYLLCLEYFPPHGRLFIGLPPFIY